ncbi:MAG: hypothetical protein AAFZ74_08855 [Pseudomonadota bacterium]
MSQRFLLLSGGAFVVCVSLVLLTAYSVGADPFHPRSRHIWALSLVAAAYASIRLAMIAGKIIDARSGEGGPALFGLIGKKEHAIDQRMAERRARVEAARKRAKDTEQKTKETGDE